MENENVQLVVPPSWEQHGRDVDNVLCQIDQRIVECKATLYDLTQQREKLIQHLQVTLPPLAGASGKDVDLSKPIQWSPDRKLLTVTLKGE